MESLQTEGILSQGYGLIAKIPMLDPELSITAKAIYAYICSLAGNGTTAFPSRDKIVSVLQINKDTYYRHLDSLLEGSYIRVEKSFQVRHQFANNVFTIVTDIDKPIKEQQLSQHKLHSEIKVPGILKLGYGMIPRSVMNHQGLSHKAKALYAYFCSFAGAGESAWPGKQATLYYLDISHGTYNKILKELVTQDFVRVEQRIERGRFGICDYILTEKPLPDTKFSDTVESDTEKQPVVKPDAAKPDAEKQDAQVSDTVEPDTTNTSPNINNLTNNSFSSISQELDSLLDFARDGESESKKELVQLVQAQTPDRIKAWIKGKTYPSQDIDYLITIVSEACFYKDLKGLSPPEFIPRLLDLTGEEYIYVKTSVSQVQGIHNLKAYYLASLLRAHEDYTAAIEQEVAADIAKGLI